MLARLATAVLGGLLILAASPPPVLAVAGVNLGWDVCGPTSPSIKTFACDTDTGSAIAVASFTAPAGVEHMTAIEYTVRLDFTSAAAPDWWQFKNPGVCRQTALTFEPQDPLWGSGACADYWQGTASGGIGLYQVTPGSSLAHAHALIRGVAVVPPGFAYALDPEVEYHAFRLRLSYASTVGSGACAGCREGVCLSLQRLTLTQPVGEGDFTISDPDRRNVIVWQGASYEWAGLCITPTQNRTWGRIKSIWR